MNLNASPLPTNQSKSSTQGGKIQVLIADDHPIVRNGLTLALEGELDIEIVGQAVDGEQAVAFARQFNPQVILMDLNMPKMNGIEATRLIAAECPHIAIIGLTMFEDEENNAAMLQAGAVAFINKSGFSAEVVSLIRQYAHARGKSAG